jgi:photosynthetic reaction center cytochrome c subunit
MRIFGIAALAVSCLSAQQTAEQVYKNIVALKGTPSDQVQPAMQVMAASLGVNCEFCHVAGKFEADDKPEKKTARQMITMTAGINQSYFGGRSQMSCYSCHRGATRPVSVVPVLESDTMPARGEPSTIAPATATADQILERYVTAAGGADAMRKLTTKAQKGVIHAMGSETPIEVLTKAPNKRVSITHSANGDSYTAFDGTAGWMGGGTTHASRSMTASESAASALDAEFYLPLRVKELYPQLRRGRPEMVNGAACDVLNGAAQGRPAVRLYFDRKTGLLTRMVRYAETPVGRNPTQIDYADYRAVDGVQVPFRWTLSRPNGRFTIQINETQANVPIDDAKFAKPAGEGR